MGIRWVKDEVSTQSWTPRDIKYIDFQQATDRLSTTRSWRTRKISGSKDSSLWGNWKASPKASSGKP